MQFSRVNLLHLQQKSSSIISLDLNLFVEKKRKKKKSIFIKENKFNLDTSGLHLFKHKHASIQIIYFPKAQHHIMQGINTQHCTMQK